MESNISIHQLLNSDELDRLHELVFEQEFNPSHPDDYSNAGGFFAHWQQYTNEERQELFEKAKNDETL